MSYKHLFLLNVKDELACIAMVNHSGELGARHIYAGQIKACKINGTSAQLDELVEMYKSELVHLDYFCNLISQQASINGFKQSLFNVVWQDLAFIMGFLSSAHSNALAMLLTQCVETVIETHYLEQLVLLDGIISITQEPNHLTLCTQLRANIYNFLQDEIEHKNHGIASSQGLNVWLRQFCITLFTFIVKFAIFASSRI